MSKFTIAIGNMFKRPATRRYPFQKPEFFENTRGNLVIDIAKCNFCGLCQKRCPTNAITVTKAEAKWSVNRLQCIVCGNCTDLCAKKALHLEKQYTAVAAKTEKSERIDTQVGSVPVKKAPTTAE